MAQAKQQLTIKELTETVGGKVTPRMVRQLKPALVIGLPIGFSHAPAAKRRLQHSRGLPRTFQCFIYPCA